MCAFQACLGPNSRTEAPTEGLGSRGGFSGLGHWPAGPSLRRGVSEPRALSARREQVRLGDQGLSSSESCGLQGTERPATPTTCRLAGGNTRTPTKLWAQNTRATAGWAGGRLKPQRLGLATPGGPLGDSPAHSGSGAWERGGNSRADTAAADPHWSRHPCGAPLPRPGRARPRAKQLRRGRKPCSLALFFARFRRLYLPPSSS